MTSQAIIGNEVNNIVTNNLSKKSDNVNSKTDSFSKVMEKNNYENQDNHVKRHERSDFHSSRPEIISSKHMHQVKNNPTNEKNNTGFMKEEFIVDVENAINDIANAYKETLDLSDEELISIMEQLAMNIFQLPMQEFAKNIVVAANGENDITSLLVNEKAHMNLQSMNQFFDKYTSETRLDVSPDELNELVKEAIDNLVAMKEANSTNQDIQIQTHELNSKESQLDVFDVNDSMDVDFVQNKELSYVESIDIGDGKKINIEILDYRHNMTKDKLELNVVKQMMDNTDQTFDTYNNYMQGNDLNISNMENKLSHTHTSLDNLSYDNVNLETSDVDNVELENLNTQETFTNHNITDDFKVDSVKKHMFNNNQSTGKQTDVDINSIDIDKSNITDTFEDISDNSLDIDLNDSMMNDMDIDTLDSNDGLDLKTDNLQVDTSKTEDILESNTNSNESQKDNSNSDMTNSTNETFYDKFITNLEKSFGIDEGSILKEVSHIKEMQEVVNQIVENIKVHISKEATTMKLNLNPEHLGKVELEVTSKSGVLTADFVVENETAKEALEKGLPTLLEKFHESGLKVEAVEVSISDYDFTRQDGERKSKADYGHEDKKKKRHGKISLDDISVTNEVVQDERQIMSNMGVDYSV